MLSTSTLTSSISQTVAIASTFTSTYLSMIIGYFGFICSLTILSLIVWMRMSISSLLCHDCVIGTNILYAIVTFLSLSCSLFRVTIMFV